MGRTLGGIEWDTHAQPEVALVIIQGHATEATQDHVMVFVVTGVLEGQNLEQTMVHPNDVVYPGPHLLATTDNDPCPAIPRPRNITREEVLHHFL